MKKVTFTLMAALLAGTVLLTGCGLKKMVKKYPTVNYKTTPEVLETHGGKIAVKVEGTFPAKYFHKKAVVNFTPVLKFNGGEHKLKTITLQGEKAKGSGIVIKKKDGGSFSYEDVIPYKPEMNVSELHVNPKACLKETKCKDLGDRKLADGVIYTSERVGKDEELTFVNDAFQKEVILTEKASIYFQVAKFNLDWNQPYNKKQEVIDALNKLKAFHTNGFKKKDVTINAWASPEGEIKFNQTLSSDRAKTAADYLKKYYEEFYTKAAKAKDKNAKPVKEEFTYTQNGNGEDWEGFLREVEASSIKDKNTILNVVKSQTDVDKREQEIKNMALIYKEIEDVILPGLRRAEITINSYKPIRTDEKIAQLSTTYPDSLENDELLYAATLTNDLNTKLKIYKSHSTIYAQDWRGYNNAGYVDLKLGNVDEAQQLLEKANSISPNNGTVLNNLGVCASWKKDYDAAKGFYEQAQAKGQDVNYNLGIIAIRKGDYPTAIQLFQGKTCRYNVALVQLLSKDNNSAAGTLECVPNKTAETHYLMAIVGSRTGNVGMMCDNLKKAIALDANYRGQAKDDREFLKYFSNSQFTDAIK